MRKLKTILPYIYLSLFILISTVIIVSASFSGEVSSEQSGTLLTVLVNVLNFFKINLSESALDVLHGIVRKLIGHFGIFFLDGIFAYLSSFYLLKYSNRTKLFMSLILGLFIAGLSEFIQLFAPERGPSLGDVMIDFLGFLVGVSLIILIQILSKHNRPTNIPT